MELSYYNSVLNTLKSIESKNTADTASIATMEILSENKDSGVLFDIAITLKTRRYNINILTHFTYYNTTIKHLVTSEVTYTNTSTNIVEHVIKNTVLESPDIAKITAIFIGYIQQTITLQIPICFIDSEIAATIQNIPMMCIYSNKKIPYSSSVLPSNYIIGDYGRYYILNNIVFYVYTTNLIEGFSNIGRFKEVVTKYNSVYSYYENYIVEYTTPETILSNIHIRNYTKIPDIEKYIQCQNEEKIAELKRKDAYRKNNLLDNIKNYTESINKLKKEISDIDKREYSSTFKNILDLPFIKSVVSGSSHFKTTSSLIVIFKDIVISYNNKHYLFKNFTLQVTPTKVYVIGVEDARGNYYSAKTNRFDNNIHPHVNTDGVICHGSEDTKRVDYETGKRDLYEYLYIIYNILSQYNPNSPYRSLDNFTSFVVTLKNESAKEIKETETELETITAAIPEEISAPVRILHVDSEILTEEDIIRATQHSF